jgi:hypothetical protein
MALSDICHLLYLTQLYICLISSFSTSLGESFLGQCHLVIKSKMVEQRMAAHLERASIEDLINQCALAGDHAQIDIIYLEIADRVKQLNDFAKEASTIIVQLLKQDNSVTVFGVVRLLEFLSKNTSPIFHQYLASKNHSEAFLLALRRVRGKKSLKNKLEKKDV